MPRERLRNIKTHITEQQGPVVVDWASPVQQEVFNYGPFPCCASGGFGAAKTYAFCMKALWLSDTFPKNRGVIARKVCKELENTTMSTFFKICPPAAYQGPGGRRADSEFYLRLNNGSEILWLHMDTDDIEGVIRGLEMNWFFIDQAEEISEELFTMMMPRLGRWDQAQVPAWLVAQEGGEENWAFRNPETGKLYPPTYAMLACNPDTELHWIYRRFHPESLEWKQQYKKRGYKMFQMDSRDNKFLPKPTLNEMMSQDESFVRRFVRGEWGIPEGQIHKVEKESVIDGDKEILNMLLRTCRLHRTLDHGDAAPTACAWWATDREGNCFCIGEYYMPNRLISDHRANITALTKDLFRGDYASDLADPSIFHKTQQKYGGRWSVSDEYSDCVNLPRENAIFWQPADNNELGTRNRISEYLRVDPQRLHPITHQPGSPRLFFLKASESFPQGCNNILRELRSQRRKKIGTDLGRPIFSDERDEGISDHGYDVVRYFIASRPAIPKTQSFKFPKKSFAATREEYLRFKAKGGFRMLADQARRQGAGLS